MWSNHSKYCFSSRVSVQYIWKKTSLKPPLGWQKLQISPNRTNTIIWACSMDSNLFVLQKPCSKKQRKFDKLIGSIYGIFTYIYLTFLWSISVARIFLWQVFVKKNPQHAEPLPQVCVLYKVPVVTFPTNAWNIWWFRNPAFTTWGWYVVEIPLSPLFTWWTIHPRWLFWDFRPTTTSTNKKDPSTNRTAVLRNGILISFPWA